MFRKVTDLRGCEIRATDGVIGRVDDVYFDDEEWGVRYLVVDTGHWLDGRRVLISPIAVGHPDWNGRWLPVALTRAQVEKSPGVDTRKPVSRQHEDEYFGYYGYPPYWGGAGLWGIGAYPGSTTLQDRVVADIKSQRSSSPRRAKDSHLRSSEVVFGYHIDATDGEIGHLQDLLLDDHTWAIRYLVVNTSNWWMGHDVLVSPQWIKTIRWADAKIVVDVTRQAIKDAPPFDASRPLDPQQEQAMREHHGHFGDRGGHAVPKAITASASHKSR